MFPLLGSAIQTGGMLSPGGIDLEAVFMYGLVAFVIGLIAWSKYREAPLSDPYSHRKPGGDFPETAHHAEVGPAVAVPVAAKPAAAREQR